MDADEKLVRDSWERAEFCPKPQRQGGCISLGGRGFTRVTVPDTIEGYAPTEAAAWAAAAEYTRERREQIRQVEEEIEIAECERETCGHIGGCDDQFPESVREEMLAQEKIWKRILAREQAALGALKQGMKQPPAQERGARP